MAAIDDLISQIQDAELRDRIQKEVNKLSKQKKFGLVFEEHLPECTPLFDMPIKRGCNVMLRDNKEDKSIYVVMKIEGDNAICTKRDNQEEISTFLISDIVRVAEFGESIYPYLKPLDSVCNAPDSDLWHTLIEADNYHALQLLEYLYAGKVDCIYIDPPYNTGAKDWKYNNDYVDSADSYRHSKWLNMMERRLQLAKKLLNPKESVLIVTIDEKEYLHLGCLLEEMFAGCSIQMVSSVINPSGSARKNLFSRAEEYLFYVFIGDAHVFPGKEDMIHPVKEDLQVRWASLLRSGSNSNREARPKLFYPVYFDESTGKFVDTGESLPLDVPKEMAPTKPGCFSVFPTKANGQDARWTLSQDTLKSLISQGLVKFGSWQKGNKTRTISYLAEGMQKALENGELEVLGRDEDGTLITGRSFKPVVPLTIWNQPSHGAGDYGSSLLLDIFREKRFSFPKSLYAVKDSLNFVVKGKPDALILDFFAGSGTTLHAVNLINAEDGGNRRCILVTNNEASESERKYLEDAGYRQGDKEWNDLGVARYVTWPRTQCSIEGHDINGKPLSGTYLDSELQMQEGFKSNVAFFQLSFLDKTAVSLGMAFNELLPVLWMKAGCKGKCPEIQGKHAPEMLILPENQFAILNNESKFPVFQEELSRHPEIQTVFLATDYEVNYRSMVKNLNVENSYQLYRDYLDHFRLNRGRS